MGGFQVGSNLQNNRPVTEGLKQALGAGLALPTVLKTTGAVVNKVTPSSFSIADGANILKKTIGFRGGNVTERAQFEKAVPVVFEDLKNTGFKPSGVSDPNNLINLDTAVTENMKKILQERTVRIEQTGGNATISGDLAATKIRNLVTPGSVEDLTNPGLSDRLDTIAKNFEGKKYSPVQAQEALIQANSGFSFSDNPTVGKQIKMAISQAFTPELDRIVAGADEVKFDAKGKAIPAKGGTAELNKKWSAYKTFQKQLEKKLITEERKAPVDLGSRVTLPEAAGKIGEAVGNPAVVTQKIVGASFEYLANKFLGDKNNINYRIYRAFNGSPMSIAIVSMLNKFQKVGDLVTFLKQNPLISHLLDKINSTDSTLQADEVAPNVRQGGYVANPFGKADELQNAVSKELNNLDTNPLTVNGKPDLTSPDTMFRLGQLKEKVNGKSLTPAETKEAAGLLKKVGIDIEKPTASLPASPKGKAVFQSKSK